MYKKEGGRKSSASEVVPQHCMSARAHSHSAAMRLPRAALLAAALLAPALLLCARAAALHSCQLLELNTTHELQKLGVVNVSALWRGVSVGGRALGVSLAWGSAPARAAAALLRALLRHVRLYRAVRLLHVPHAARDLAVSPDVRHRLYGDYNDLVIDVSTAWEPTRPRPWKPHGNDLGGLAGPRLQEFGASAVPARCRLHARLSRRALARADCARHSRWHFYSDALLLKSCDFGQSNVSAAEVLIVGECDAARQRLVARARASATTLRLTYVNRTGFARARQDASRSFLFLDYDMWDREPGVSAVEPPPCETVDFQCRQDLDSAIAMRVADVDILKTYAPELFMFVNDFNPSHESLRQILESHASGVDIEQVACEWALKNKSYEITNRQIYDLSEYNVIICYCRGDPDFKFFKNITSVVENVVRNQTVPMGYKIKLHTYRIECTDSYAITNKLEEFKTTEIVYSLLGVVSLLVENVAATSALATAGHVPLLLADVVPEEGARGATWRVAGRPRHIARALQHLVRLAGWRRVAVLCQDTQLAADYYDALRHSPELILQKFPINGTNFTAQQAQGVLKDLRDKNARIVFVNTDSRAAHTILSAAGAGRMGYEDGIVWIVREWRQNNSLNFTKHFTVSFWTRGLEDMPPGEDWSEMRKALVKLWPDRAWPPRAVSLADALLTISIGFKDVFHRYPNSRQDLRNAQMIKSLTESVIGTPVAGVSQRLHYKESSIEETFVYVDMWRGGQFEQRLARWRVNATSGEVRGLSQDRANWSRPADLPRDDGSSHCTVRSGDEFQPTCHDFDFVLALLLLALTSAAILLARRTLLRRLARLQREKEIQVIARRQHVATALAAYLVKRDALELHEELGAGRFGSVRLARLHSPGRAPRYIAAKALRDNAAPAEESEFLREACTIASLNHAHVVRLVGVCIADGPPLVLMELAFFGDLLGYMRARRHLVEDVGSYTPAESGEMESGEAESGEAECGEAESGEAESGEAEHVSAEALTRLAREAAEALHYLDVRGVVHRDVRAANCLVDVRRSLKLADFGMARDTVAGADGAPEYACRRRGLFPVLWMAPESLAHGVFSAASDVWALGVLVLELVTLGVRPYGSMSPLRVLEYVAAGGSPPLPLDATPQTRGLVRLCWARVAERRPSAAEVAAYLSARPRALRPALLSARDGPPDADSGFGESPSTELLPPGSPLHSVAQLEDLAITH